VRGFPESFQDLGPLDGAVSTGKPQDSIPTPGAAYRCAVFAYGLVAYALFGMTFLYAVGFLGNILVPKSLDSPPSGPWTAALLTDLSLLGVHPQ